MFLQKGLDSKIDQVSDLPGGRASPCGNHMLLLLRERDGTGFPCVKRMRFAIPAMMATPRCRREIRDYGLRWKPFKGACAARVFRRTPDRASEIIRIEQQGHCLLGREFSVNNANAIGVVTPIPHPLALTEF
jgi:hypothetical protein